MRRIELSKLANGYHRNARERLHLPYVPRDPSEHSRSNLLEHDILEPWLG